MTTKAASSAIARTSKACENCRLRRIRCDGGLPCRSCAELGLEQHCSVRTKARPNRGLPKAIIQRLETRVEQSSPNVIVPCVGIVESITLRTAAFATTLGLDIDFHIPNGDPATPPARLPGAAEQAAFEAFLPYTQAYFRLLSAARMNDLYARWESEPDTLAPDQVALLFACLGFGVFSQRWKEDKSWLTYYTLTLETIDAWGSASITALDALIVLHMLSHSAAGPHMTREVLRRAAWQVMELRLHKSRSTHTLLSVHPPDRYYWEIMYKDAWFASLCDLPPFLKPEDCALPQPSFQQREGIAFDPCIPFFLHLAQIENEIVTGLHQSIVDEKLLLEWEGKLNIWLQRFRKEYPTERVPTIHFAEIRFAWLCILLRYPHLDHPTSRLSSLFAIARSVSKILHSYVPLKSDPLFSPKWAEVRRIATCGQLLVYCYWEKEFTTGEAKELARILLILLDWLDEAPVGGKHAKQTLCALMESANLRAPMNEVQDSRAASGFELATLPVSMSETSWFDTFHFDYT